MKPEFLESAEFYNRRYHNFFQSGDFTYVTSVRVLLGFAVLQKRN